MSAYFRNWMLLVPSALIALSTSPAMAATATLSGSTSNNCIYTGYTADANGNLSVTCSGGGTPVDPSQPGTVQLSSSSYSVAAGSSAVITLSRTGGTAGQMSIPLSITGGTAVAGTNYTTPVSPIVMNDGVASVAFNISTVSNSAGPAWNPTTKTVGFTLGAPSVGALGAASSAILTINDNFVPDTGVPLGCTIVPVTWTARLSLTFHPKSVMLNGQSFAFLKKLDPQGLNYASASYATTSKYMSISKKPCDFSAELEAKSCARGSARGNEVSLDYAPIGTNRAGYCEVDTGDYYINVRNSTTRDGPDSCPAGTNCEYWLSW